MKGKIYIGIVIISCFFLGLFCYKEFNRNPKDENVLYQKKLKNTILQFKKIDVALGQKNLVLVEKSTNKGKTFKKITKEALSVSQEARFLFLNSNLGFVISTENITRTNDFIGVKVTKDGGVHFQDAKFFYENDRIDIITIENVPYQKENLLYLDCSVYDVKEDHSGYQDIKLKFVSRDNGLTWRIEE